MEAHKISLEYLEKYGFVECNEEVIKMTKPNVAVEDIAPSKLASPSPKPRKLKQENFVALNVPRSFGQPYNINSWPKIRTLPEELGNKMRSFLPLNGSSSLLITRYDRVFAIGINNDGMLGTGNLGQVMKPVEVRELRCEQVVDIVAGDGHVLARTQAGKLWQWGRGQVADGFVVDINPKEVELEANIISVKVGLEHCLALSAMGLVFNWGGNAYGQLGIGDRVGKQTPVLLESLKNIFIVQIAAGAHHSLALSDDGRAFGWGSNVRGQLNVCQEITDRTDQLTPLELKLFDNVDEQSSALTFKAIAAGDGVSLLLTKHTAQVYQLGVEGVKLIELDKSEVKTKSIYLHYASNLRVAKTENNKLYFWGRVEDDTDGEVTKPVLLDKVQQLCSEVFVIHAPRTITPFMLERNILERSQLQPTLDDKQKSDFRFTIDGHSIYVHRYHLSTVSLYFKKMFSGVWKNFDEIVLDNQEYHVYYNYIRFLYENVISLNSLEESIKLLKLANENCEERLELASIDEINRYLSPETAACFYELSVTFDLVEWQQQLATFISLNYRQVKLTAAFKEMKAEKAKLLLAFMLENCEIEYNKML